MVILYVYYKIQRQFLYNNLFLNNLMTGKAVRVRGGKNVYLLVIDKIVERK